MNFKITSSEIVSILSPTDINPRNSEGDFLTLRDGTIMFTYTAIRAAKTTIRRAT